MPLSVTVDAQLSGAVRTDLTDDVRVAEGLVIDWGMDGGGPDDNCARPGTCALSLDNRARGSQAQGRYSPGHANCLAGFDLNVPLRVHLQTSYNELVDGGAESYTWGTTDWFWVYNEAAASAHGITTSAPYAGAKCFYITWTAPQTAAQGLVAWGHVAHPRPWAPNTTYVISFRAKTASALSTASPCDIGWDVAPAMGAWVTNPNLTTSWQYYEGWCTTDSTVQDDGRLYIYIQNVTQDANTLYFDNVMLERGDVAHAFDLHVGRTLGPYRITDILPRPGQYGDQTVAVVAADWLEEAAEAPVIYSGAVNQPPETVISTLIGKMDRQPTATALGVGVNSFPYPLSDLQGADNRILSAFKNLAQSAGGSLYLTSAGTLTFEAPSARQSVMIGDFSLSDTMQGLTVERSRAGLVNSIQITTHAPIVSTGLVILGSLTEPLYIPAGATRTVAFDYRDPTTLTPCGGANIQTPTASTDYVANTMADGSGTDKTAQLTVAYPYASYPGASQLTYVVTNGDTVDVWLTTLQVRGQSVVDTDPVTVTSESASSIAAYGRKTLTVNMAYQADPNVAQALADYWRALYADASTRAQSLTIGPTDDGAHLSMMMTAEIGDFIELIETLALPDTAGARNDYVIQGVHLQIVGGPHIEATYRVAPALGLIFMMLDDVTFGALDAAVTTLAYL